MTNALINTKPGEMNCKVGVKEWFMNDKRHRTDGPAIEWPDGTKEWFLNDRHYPSFDDWLEAVDATEQGKISLKLKWA
jgi:hypothetical protein